jgi:uncharacterized membrane protein YecN with MAPEG domain
MKLRSQYVLERMVPPLAVWAVGKVLDTPRVQHALHKVDRKIYPKHRAWFAAGAAVIVIGLGLMARAAKN